MAEPESKAKLDMSHGFMKSIVRNQIDRDNYDKEVKARQMAEKKISSKPKRPAMQTYVPPVKQRENQAAKPKIPLFKVEFEDKNGEVVYLMVYKDDDPQRVANRFGSERKLPPPLIRALAQKLTEEMEMQTQTDLKS